MPSGPGEAPNGPLLRSHVPPARFFKFLQSAQVARSAGQERLGDQEAVRPSSVNPPPYWLMTRGGRVGGSTCNDIWCMAARSFTVSRPHRLGRRGKNWAY